MKRIILCEGSTDTAFLGYYMSKVFGWKYVSVNDKDLTSVGITNRKNNESMKWYKKENDFLAICGVGGKDNFKKFFEVQLKEMITLTGDFDKIAVVTDRDDKSIKSIEEALFFYGSGCLRKQHFRKIHAMPTILWHLLVKND